MADNPYIAPDLAEIGEALFGPHWQSPMARSLDVSLRTMQRWAAGDRAPPKWVVAQLAIMLARRHAQNADILKRCLGRP